MNRLRGLLFLMALVTLVIAGFQVYWLKDNYAREKKSLEVRANSFFRETVRLMQDSIIRSRMQFAVRDTSARIRVSRTVEDGKIAVPRPSATTARVIRVLGEAGKRDTMRRGKARGVFISVKGRPFVTSFDSSETTKNLIDSLPGDGIREMVMFKSRNHLDSIPHVPLRTSPDRSSVMEFSETIRDDSIISQVDQSSTLIFKDGSGDQFVLRLDSLDAIPLDHLHKEVERVFIAEQINLPFEVSLHRNTDRNSGTFNSGFPFDQLPYNLQFKNTVSYLLKQITWPIVFSFFLVGITVFAFILLYRNMMRQYRLGVMKNDLISNISHELKTPIATVGVALEALKNFNAIDDAAKTREYLDISQQEIQRLNLLVDKVLKLSVFEKKQMDLKKEWFDTRELVHQIINSMKVQFEKYGATVNIQEEGENFQLEADKLHISSILYNLLDNALKYSKERPVITVFLKSLKEHLELGVIDNGIGIPKAYKSKVFDKFFRVPMGDKHDAKGYGLGLSYVSELLKRHQGFITVDSEVDKGSVFTAFIPYQEKDIIDFGGGRKIRKENFKIGH